MVPSLPLRNSQTPGIFPAPQCLEPPENDNKQKHQQTEAALWMKMSKEWEMWEVEAVILVEHAHCWIQASKNSGVLAGKRGSYLLYLSRCNWYMGHRAQEEAWMFYKWRWVSAVCSWSLASHAQTILNTGSWVGAGAGQGWHSLLWTQQGCHIPSAASSITAKMRHHRFSSRIELDRTVRVVKERERVTGKEWKMLSKRTKKWD